MKKVFILDSSLRPGFTRKAAAEISAKLQAAGVQTELMALREQTVHPCCGCCVCLSQGSSRCPYAGDGARAILGRLMEADGVVFVVPNYALSIPGNLKTLLDRLSYVFHRPRLFGRAFLPVMVQGVYGGKKVTEYLNEVMDFWGFKTVKGTVLAGGIYPGQPVDEKIADKNARALSAATDRFVEALQDERPRKPSFFRLAIFRATRTSMKYLPEALQPDREFYARMGWLDSAYFYPVRLNPAKRLFGAIIDRMVRSMCQKGGKKKAAPPKN